ncbi:hypothetical protein [Asticcacaulis sp. AND118]|uniref:trypsin-like peptidase domain-containing protein n=1 Tax=Asticcacaulis sp. AND118 TaxID=2840468 RepID=UPI001CFF58F1|nr:hypothetical protein [Asticcacaulis sp. AND118]UDF04041.1 hypothetical protein LH365_03065 [Asticcacaulis sp. AND118]
MKRLIDDRELEAVNLEAAEILADLVDRAIKPYLVAIYAPRIDHPDDISQVGTAFVVQNGAEVVLISARHVFYGHAEDEVPGEKLFFVKGVLKSVGDLTFAQIYGADGFDLACVRLPELALEDGMPWEWLQLFDKPKYISVVGYLARDFKRSRHARTLRPKPYLYSNKCRKLTSLSVVMEYPKSKNRIAVTRKRAMAPVPRGVSGGPMLRAEKMLTGRVEVVGVFTDYVDGTGIGVPTAIVRRVLQRIRDAATLLAGDSVA